MDASKVFNQIEPKPILVFLNGATSSGKSTIARTMLEKSPFAFIHFSMDDFLSTYNAMLPEQYRGKQNPTSPETVLRMMASNAAQYMEEDRHVVIDAVAFPKAMDIWLNVLKKYNPILVGVTAPLAILEEREKKRGDRPEGSAKEQHRAVLKDIKYDLIVDSSIMTPEAAADIILDKILNLGLQQKSLPQSKPQP